MRKLALAILLGGTTVMTAGVIGSTGPAEARSHSYCVNYAHSYARQYSNPGNAALGGAVTGGVIGSVVGWATGNWGPGAIIGGSIGSIGSAMASSGRYNQLYSYAYNWCRSH